jgi:hypothetical protein
VTQGSSFLATLGWMIPSLRDGGLLRATAVALGHRKVYTDSRYR